MTIMLPQQNHGPLFAGRKPTKTETIIKNEFKGQNFDLTNKQIKSIKGKVENSVEHLKKSGVTSTSHMNAVEIAQDLGLNPMVGTIKQRIMNALVALKEKLPVGQPAKPTRPEIKDWKEYYDKTLNMTNNKEFLSLVNEKGFSPVKISWEDISRYEGSCWGDRISDVGVWVREFEDDPSTAKLALTVRRDGNFRDKVLMVPSENIKIHSSDKDGKVSEVSLPEKLKELGLLSKEGKDKNVIVSNQFTIVPVPSANMEGAWKKGETPRAAFTFSIQPYGSKTAVITDVMKGNSVSVVDGYKHQLIYANKDGEKAPFTASRAEDRKDLQEMEKELKKKGMDVDIKRYYLIQVPLKKDAPVRASENGDAPRDGFGGGMWGGGNLEACFSLAACADSAPRAAKGLGDVAIDYGEGEGPYQGGSGYEGNRDEQAIRVTVSYFVTPKGEVTKEDMENFSKTFEQWDNKAIWGGSFVTPEGKEKKPSEPPPIICPPIVPFNNNNGLE